MNYDIDPPNVGDTIDYRPGSIEGTAPWVVKEITSAGDVVGKTNLFPMSDWPGTRYVSKRAWQPKAGDRVRHRQSGKEGVLCWCAPYMYCKYDDTLDFTSYEVSEIPKYFTKVETARQAHTIIELCINGQMVTAETLHHLGHILQVETGFADPLEACKALVAQRNLLSSRLTQARADLQSAVPTELVYGSVTYTRK